MNFEVIAVIAIAFTAPNAKYNNRALLIVSMNVIDERKISDFSKEVRDLNS